MVKSKNTPPTDRTPKRRIAGELTERELIVLSAAFARSNMGHGNPPKTYVQQLLTSSGTPSLSSSVLMFCEQFMETDEHQAMFETEAKSWVKSLRKVNREYVVATWPDMAALFWPTVSV